MDKLTSLSVHKQVNSLLLFTADSTTGALSAGGSPLRKHQPYVCTAESEEGEMHNPVLMV